MRFFGKLVTELTEADLANLKGNRISEGQTLDFKRDPYTKSDRDKRELLKDVVGMANASGGVILIGVDDEDDVATAVPGVTLDSPTEPMQWYSNLILSCVEPRLSGVQMHRIPIGDGSRHVIAIGIPQSLNRPHRSTWDRSQRFTIRHNRDTSDMTYEELRRAFLDGETITRRVQEFQQRGGADLLNAISETHLTERSMGILVVQILPLYPGATTLDVRAAGKMQNELPTLGGRGGGYALRPTFDGVCAGKPPDPDQRLWSWLQLSRDGRVQSSSGDYRYLDRSAEMGNGPSPHRGLGVNEIVQHVVTVLPRYISALGVLGFNPPFGFSMSLLNIGQTYFQSTSAFQSDPIALNSLFFEPVLIEDPNLSGDWHHIVRPTFDQLWNAYGLEACWHFDSDGKWKLRV